MALSKEEMINSIYKRFKVIFDSGTDEKVLIDVLAGKYSRPEVINLAKGRNAREFTERDLRAVPTNNLKRLAEKYSKRAIPTGVSRQVIMDILLKRVNVDKVLERDLRLFGKKARSTVTGAIDLYAGWIPKLKKSIKEKDIERGKRAIKSY